MLAMAIFEICSFSDVEILETFPSLQALIDGKQRGGLKLASGGIIST